MCAGGRHAESAGAGQQVKGVATLAAQMSVVDFYDALAEDFDLVYGGHWQEAVSRHGEALDRLIQTSLGPGPKDVLDCSCGIGTQALGLAMRGHRVQGTDISERSIERARREASRLELDARFAVADFRDLGPVAGTFDVVISCDNAIPHLLADSEILQALASMHTKLRPGGLLAVSVRDYDQWQVDRQATAPPTFISGPPRRLLVRFHDWMEGRPIYDLHFFVLSELGDEWTLTAHHRTRYRALARRELLAAARDAGFEAIEWREPQDVGFHQPVLTARA
jgi:glycine/sarcosine N-methyltransferase